MDLPLIGSYDLEAKPHSVQRTVNLIPVPQEPGNERTAWVLKDVKGLETFLTTPDAHICTEGPDWTARTVPVGLWFGLAYGGGRYVITGGDADLKSAYSTDGGVTWNLASTIPSTGSVNLGAVAYLEAAGLFVCCGNAIAMLTSPDGDVWTSNTVPSFGNSGIKAAGDYVWVFQGSASSTIKRTADGVNYTACTMPASANWTDVAYNGSRYVAVSDSRLAYSDDDGANWTTGPTYASDDWSLIEYGNGVFSIIDTTSGGGRSMVSVNGTAVSTPASTAFGFTNLLFAQGVFMAMGADDEVYTSLDGETWTLSASLLPSTQTWGNLSTDGNGGYFVVRTAAASATQGASGVCG